MNRNLFLLVGSLVALLACGDDREPVDAASRGDGSVRLDAGRAGDAGPRPDGASTDTGVAGSDGGSSDVDGAVPALCDPACLEAPGARCCTDCGCGGAAMRCEPMCSSPYRWDC